MVVSLVILKQGVSLFAGAFGELTDAGVSQRTQRVLSRALHPLVSPPSPSDSSSSNSSSSVSTLPEIPLISISKLRAQRSGANIFVDVDARVPASLSVEDAVVVEERIRDALVEVRKEIAEVRVKFIPVFAEDSVDGEAPEEKPEELHLHSHR